MYKPLYSPAMLGTLYLDSWMRTLWYFQLGATPLAQAIIVSKQHIREVNK